MNSITILSLWRGEFSLPWREAGPPNQVDSDKQVVNKEVALWRRGGGVPGDAKPMSMCPTQVPALSVSHTDPGLHESWCLMHTALWSLAQGWRRSGTRSPSPLESDACAFNRAVPGLTGDGSGFNRGRFRVQQGTVPGLIGDDSGFDRGRFRV